MSHTSTSNMVFSVAQGVRVDGKTRVQLMDGVYAAKQIINGTTGDEWAVWLETNADPAMIPHPDYAEDLAAWLADAGVTREELDKACERLGVRWHDGM